MVSQILDALDEIRSKRTPHRARRWWIHVNPQLIMMGYKYSIVIDCLKKWRETDKYLWVRQHGYFMLLKDGWVRVRGSSYWSPSYSQMTSLNIFNLFGSLGVVSLRDGSTLRKVLGVCLWPGFTMFSWGLLTKYDWGNWFEFLPWTN